MEKKAYFTTENISQKSSQMLSQIESLKARHPQPLKSQNCALLILDMQNYFLTESSHAFIPSGRTIIPGISSLIDVCAGNGLPVIFTQHTNTETDAKMMGKWWRELISPEDEASQIIPEFETADFTVIEKTQYDAFYQTRLEEVLHHQEISQVIICGVMTHLCCETTARSAFMRGFEVFFAIDGTATYTESFHIASLQNLAHGFAVPILIEEAVTAINNTDEH